MRKYTLILICLVYCKAVLAVPALMPQPAEVHGTGALVALSQPLQVSVIGPVQAPVQAPVPGAHQGAVALFAQFQPQLAVQQVNNASAQLQIRYSHDIAVPGPEDNESYQLVISAGRITLTAPTSTGVLYGLMTLSQLVQCKAVTQELNDTARVNSKACSVPTLTINDQPRFRWRGLLLDSARRFLPPADIRRTLDGMAAAKLNVLHWHLTDDQGWRIESKVYPKLQQLASQGQFYSQTEVRDIVAYAAARGIRVVPELDLPGHASAIGMAYPELLAWPDQMLDQHGLKPLLLERRFGVFAPVLDVSNPASWQFIRALVQEWRGLFPDPYLHIGGDEVKADYWLANSAVQRLMQQHQLQDGHAVQAYFNQQLAVLLQQHQRKMIGWDEVLHPALPVSTLVQSWQGQDALGAAVRAGHPALLSAGFYLDMPQPAFYHWQNDPLQVTAPLVIPTDVQQKLQFAYALQRLNGKTVTGVLRLYQSSNGQWQGSLSASGRGVVSAQVRLWSVAKALQVRVDADNYLGPVQLRFRLDQTATSDALALIGNHSYPLQLTAQPYTPLPATAALTAAQQQLLWGGEAALWTELVPPELLDTKLWPRLLVVAERFWSPATALKATDLPARLQQMDHYATQIGMLHRQQAQARLQQWATRELGALTPAQWQALSDFSQYLQPLHYYGRHHLKTAAGRYHLDAPLDQLADALLLEPSALLALQQGFATAPACQLPADWPQWQRAFVLQQQRLADVAKVSPELEFLLQQQRQFNQMVSAAPTRQLQTKPLLEMLHPAGEVVFAPAAAALDWVDRCAALPRAELK